MEASARERFEQSYTFCKFSLVVPINTGAIFSSKLVNCVYIVGWNFDNVIRVCSVTLQFVPSIWMTHSTVNPTLAPFRSNPFHIFHCLSPDLSSRT